MQKLRENLHWWILGILVAATALIWYAVAAEDRAGKLTVAFLDVGQGDALFIESPTGTQMLIDGGPGAVVLRELGKLMPFYDRTIDVLVVSNPDKDHMAGFIDVLDAFRVGAVVEPGTVGASAEYKTLEEKIAEEENPSTSRSLQTNYGWILPFAPTTPSRRLDPPYRSCTPFASEAGRSRSCEAPSIRFSPPRAGGDGESPQRILARRGQRIELGGGAYFEVLFPDREVSGLDTNDGSIVGKLVYGDTSFLLTGDTTEAVENYLAHLDGKQLDVDVLKVGHHGSKTSTGAALLGFASPTMAVISAGRDNRYGHPHQEVLARLTQFEVETLGTYERGTIVMESNGETITIKK